LYWQTSLIISHLILFKIKRSYINYLDHYYIIQIMMEILEEEILNISIKLMNQVSPRKLPSFISKIMLLSQCSRMLQKLLKFHIGVTLLLKNIISLQMKVLNSLENIPELILITTDLTQERTLWNNWELSCHITHGDYIIEMKSVIFQPHMLEEKLIMSWWKSNQDFHC